MRPIRDLADNKLRQHGRGSPRGFRGRLHRRASREPAALSLGSRAFANATRSDFSRPTAKALLTSHPTSDSPTTRERPCFIGYAPSATGSRVRMRLPNDRPRGAILRSRRGRSASPSHPYRDEWGLRPLDGGDSTDLATAAVVAAVRQDPIGDVIECLTTAQVVPRSDRKADTRSTRN